MQKELRFFRLVFEVIRPITNLQFYQGIYFNAMLRDWIRPYTDLPLSELGLYPLPLVNGVDHFDVGEKLGLDLVCRQDSLHPLYFMLANELRDQGRSVFKDEWGHFVPGKSLQLLSYEPLFEEEISPQCQYITDEMNLLCREVELSLIFHSPLRLKPDTKGEGGHRYLDPLNLDSKSFFGAFAKEMGIVLADEDYPEIIDKGFIWLDMLYEKSLGGIVGGLRIKTPKDKELLRALVWGQYLGLGKNRTFGFGYYYIKESSGFRAKNQSPCQNPLFERCTKISNIRSALEELKSSSPGPDQLAKEDLVNAGRAYLESAQRQLYQKKLMAGESIVFRKRNRNGSYRLIKVGNISERHLLLCILRQIGPLLDPLISNECYSYRQGRDYHMAARKLKGSFQEAFSLGLKADIAAFFDSISQGSLRLLLKGLFYHDEIADLIIMNLLSGDKGVSQGNPISPILSNLYLIPFDREIKRKGWQLIRYADDFCLIATDEDKAKYLNANEVDKILSGLNLRLNMEKSYPFRDSVSIDFCGYKVGKGEFYKLKQKAADEDLLGIPAFQGDLVRGKPLYLSYKDSFTYLEGNSICIKNMGETRRYSLKEISRIIVIGKPRISAGLIQQALIKEKPVSFISIMGKSLGGFFIQKKLVSAEKAFNPIVRDWEQFCLQFVKSLISAKLHNQRLVLKQHKIEEPRLKEIELSLTSVDNIESLRGKEGAASSIYWSHFRKLVEPLSFPRRAYHPPEGPVNALLSIGYSMLYNRMGESINAIGLNAWEGIYHQGRGSHMALASDLIEPFRFLVDRIVLSLIHTKQVSNNDFVQNSYNSYQRLAPETMKKYIHKFEMTMRTETKIGDDKLSWAIIIDNAPAKLLQSLRLGIDYRSYRLS